MADDMFRAEDLVRRAKAELAGTTEWDVATRQVYLESAIDLIHGAASRSSDPDTIRLLAASSSVIVAASTPQPLGQCKEAEPYAGIYIVFDSKGHRFECTHDPVHSVEIGGS